MFAKIYFILIPMCFYGIIWEEQEIRFYYLSSEKRKVRVVSQNTLMFNVTLLDSTIRKYLINDNDSSYSSYDKAIVLLESNIRKLSNNNRRFQ